MTSSYNLLQVFQISSPNWSLQDRWHQKKMSPQFKLVKHRGLALSCNGAQGLLEAAGFVMKDEELEVRKKLEVWGVDFRPVHGGEPPFNKREVTNMEVS